MLFNSFLFLFFLLVVAIVIYILPGQYQWMWLLVSSIFFYYTLSANFLILFVALIIINYCLGIAIENSKKKRKITFIVALGINIIALSFFKYFGFFQSLYVDLHRLSRTNTVLTIFLPAGMSFFTFTILSYLIEVKRETVKAEKHIGIFASSLLFFPKILQGPIEKPGNIFPQFKQEKSFNTEMVIEGLKLILWGYFKKLVVADRLAIYVNAVYDNYDQHNGISLLLATVFFSFQIYADFSGYTDIAMGSAKVLGFDLTKNFARPLFSTSIKEFWNRWHISFSVWLKDYIFLPLAVILSGKLKRNKYFGISKEKVIFIFATLITFSICGLWHGEGLNFLIWGLLFSSYLIIANLSRSLTKKLRKRLGISMRSTSYKIYEIIFTFILVSFTWIFFRAETAQDAIIIMQRIFSFQGIPFIDKQTLFYGIIAISFLILMELYEEIHGGEYLFIKSNNWIKEQVFYACIAALIILIGVFDGGQFIYFQF